MSTYMMAAGAEMPIGYIFEFDATGLTGAPDLSTAAKVREYFGYGTWAAYGAGRVTVGAGGGYAVGSEGGEATHTLTGAEMPKHSHSPVSMHWAVPASPIQEISSRGTIWYYKLYGIPEGDYPVNDAYISTEGGSTAHNNLQPYRTVYRWRRIA